MFTTKLRPKVFLGGTCCETTWRDELIELLKTLAPDITYFNPIVKDWNEEAQKIENFIKENSTIQVYVISPQMRGVYSIAEMVDAAHQKDTALIFYIMTTDSVGERTFNFNDDETRSLEATARLLCEHGAIQCHSIQEVFDAITTTYLKENTGTVYRIPEF